MITDFFDSPPPPPKSNPPLRPEPDLIRRHLDAARARIEDRKAREIGWRLYSVPARTANIQDSEKPVACLGDSS
jgi:hypothetical protein